MKITQEAFIEKAKKIHGSKYDYSLSKYLGMQLPITIICSVHGKFQQRPDVHIRGNGKGSGCTECAGRSPLNYWLDLNNQKTFLTKLAEEYSVTCIEDWYTIPASAYPGRLLQLYDNYHSKILAHHFPAYDWCEWLFTRAPKNFWTDELNRKRYMDWLGQKLGYVCMEDWYRVSGDEFRKHKGSALLQSYFNNVPNYAVSMTYSHYPWKQWLFATTPDGFWEDKNNRRAYMEWLSVQLGYRTSHDWYNLTFEILTKNKGLGIYRYFGSVCEIVKDFMPNTAWCEWQFAAVSPNFWETQNNRKRYMDWLGQQLGYVCMEDWYRVTVDDFQNHCGGGLLQSYNSSPSVAVSSNYPDYNWLEWKFTRSCFGVWETQNNRKRYMDWLGQQLGYVCMEDWYRVTVDDFQNHCGGALLGNVYKGSPSTAVSSIYSEYKWNISKFSFVPNGYWQNQNNRKKFIDELFISLKHNSWKDWYKSTHDDFVKFGGHGFLKYYDGSAMKAIMENYPQHDWLEWLFNVVPQGFWQSSLNQRRYMDWLGEQLGYSHLDDWYNVKGYLFEENFGGGFLSVCFGGSPVKAVINIYNEHTWDVERFYVGKKNQKRIYRIIKQHYVDAQWEYKHPDCRFSKTNCKMEIDIWIPSKNIAIEYQGEQHSMPIPFFGGIDKFIKTQNRDTEKRRTFLNNGISLVEIPHTWDGSPSYVLQKIQEVVDS